MDSPILLNFADVKHTRLWILAVQDKSKRGQLNITIGKVYRKTVSSDNTASDKGINNSKRTILCTGIGRKGWIR